MTQNVLCNGGYLVVLLSIQTLLFAGYCTTCSIEVMRSTAINHRQTTLWVWGCVIKEGIQWSSGGFWPRMVPNFPPLCFSFAFGGASVHSGKLTVPKPLKSLKTTQKNKAYWTLFIWLPLSGFWGWNVTICGIKETFLRITCILPKSTIANYKQCKSLTSISNNWCHPASNPQGCLPVNKLGEIYIRGILSLWSL